MSRLVLAAPGNRTQINPYLLSEGYIELPSEQGRVFMLKSEFLNEISGYDEDTQLEMMERYCPEFLGLDPATIGVLITTGGKVINYVKGLFGDKAKDPSFFISPAKILQNMSIDNIKGFLDKGNAVYFNGKVFLTEQGYKQFENQMTAQPQAAAFVKGIMDGFPFSVPDSWKSSLTSYEQKEQPTATAPTTTPGTVPGATLPSPAPGGTRPGFFQNLLPANDQRQFQFSYADQQVPFYRTTGGMILIGLGILGVGYGISRMGGSKAKN